MTLIETILNELFTESGELNLEKAVLFVNMDCDVKNSEDVKKLENKVFESLANLKLPEEFIVHYFDKFNPYDLILNNNFTDTIVLDNLKYFAILLIRNASQDNEVLYRCVETIMETDILSDIIKAKLVFEALKILKDTMHDTEKTYKNEEEREMILDEIKQRYDIIFIAYREFIIKYLENVCNEFNSEAKESFLPWVYIVISTITSLEIPEEIESGLVEEDYIQAIDILVLFNDMVLIRKVVHSYNKFIQLQ